MRRKWDNRIAFVKKYPELLSNWEDGFILSIEERRSEGRDLSPKEVSVLYDIFKKAEGKIG